MTRSEVVGHTIKYDFRRGVGAKSTASSTFNMNAWLLYPTNSSFKDFKRDFWLVRSKIIVMQPISKQKVYLGEWVIKHVLSQKRLKLVVWSLRFEDWILFYMQLSSAIVTFWLVI